MSNEIQKYSMPQSEMMEMAKLFIESKMFPDMNAVGMAFVKIQAGKEIGIAPFAAMSGIHIIKGKATIGAGLMAGCVKGSGKYDYKVVKMDETICSIDFMQAGKVIGNSQFTIAEAKKAGTQNLEKFPKNMLFARAMSNGVKWFCPDVFTMPVYTPEEMGDPNFTEDIPHEEVKAATPVAKPQERDIETETINAKRSLLAADDLAMLAKVYKALPKDIQAVTVALKDELKAKLTPVTIVTPVEGAALAEKG